MAILERPSAWQGAGAPMRGRPGRRYRGALDEFSGEAGLPRAIAPSRPDWAKPPRKAAGAELAMAWFAKRSKTNVRRKTIFCVVLQPRTRRRRAFRCGAVRARRQRRWPHKPSIAKRVLLYNLCGTNNVTRWTASSSRLKTCFQTARSVSLVIGGGYIGSVLVRAVAQPAEPSSGSIGINVRPATTRFVLAARIFEFP